MQERRGLRSWRLALLVIVAGVATTPATALLLPDQSEAGAGEVDRRIQPVDLSTKTAWLVGGVSALVAVAAVLVVVRTTRSQPSAEAWTLAAAAFVVAGGIIGVAYVVGTAKVTGANIGFGIVVMGGTPTFLAAIVVGVVATVRGWRRDRQQTTVAI